MQSSLTRADGTCAYYAHSMSWKHPKVDPKDPPPGFIFALTAAEIPFALKHQWHATSQRAHFGFMPGSDGNCRWIGIARDGDRHIHVLSVLDENTGRKMQHEWLRSIRHGEQWHEVRAKLGITESNWSPLAASQRNTRAGFTKRSWDGWSGGRPIPYFRAALLAQAMWEIEAENICRKRRINDDRYPNKSR